MHEGVRILHLEDVSFDAELIARQLSRANLSCTIKVVDQRKDFEQALEEFVPEIILSDHSLPSFSSFEALKLIQERQLKIPFVLVTGTMSDEFAVEAMKLGIDDYVIKERLHRLPNVVSNVLQKHKLRIENEHAKKQLEFDRRNIDALINSLEGAMWSIDKELKLVTANRKFIHWVTRLTGEEVRLGDGLMKLAGYDEASYTKWEQRYSRALAGETFQLESYEERSEAWIETFFNPIMEGEIVMGVACFTRNINERKAYEKKIVEQNNALLAKRQQLESLSETLSRIMNSSVDVICTFDKDGRFVNVSAAASKVWGYAPGELIGRRYMDFVHPEWHRATISCATEVMRGMDKTYFENVYIRKDGIEVPIIWSARWDNVRQLIYAIARDATVLKNIENEKRKSDILFEEMVQHSTDMIAILDCNGNYSFVSNNVEPILGYSTEYFIGRSPFEILHPDDVERIREALDYVVHKGRMHVADFRIRHRDGSWRWVETTGTNKLDHPSIRGILINTRDITERRVAELKVKESNERYNLVSIASNDVIWDFDLEKNVYYTSANFEKIFGYKEDSQASYHAWESRIYPGDRERIVNGLRHFLNSSENIYESEYRFRKVDGVYAHVYDRTFVVRDSEGRAIRMVGAMQDITQLKETELRLSESNERYDIVSQATDDIIWDWNMSEQKIYRSANISKFGYSNEELQEYGAWFRHVHPEDLPRVTASIDQYLQNPQGTWEAEYRFSCSNGNLAFIYERARVIFNQEGKPVRMVGAMQDVTKLKATENKLKETIERYNFAAAATNDVIWDWSFEDQSVYRSANFSKVFGFSTDDLQRASAWQEAIHPDDKMRVASQLENFLSTGLDHMEHEYRLVKPDGNIAFVFDRANLIRDVNGIPKRMVGAMQDITALKQAENQLKESIDRYNLAANATNDVIWDWNYKENTYYRSEIFSKLFYYPPDTLNRRDTWENALHPDDRERVEKHLEELMESDQLIWEDEYRFIRADGTIAYVEDRGNLIRDENGKPFRMVGAMRDVTARREMEMELRESNERYNLVAIATNDVIWDWDIIGENHYWGDNLYDKFGYYPHQFSSAEKWASHIHPDDRERTLNKFQQYVQNPIGSWDDQYRLVKPGGEIVHIYDRGSVMFDADGKPVRIVGAMQDITLRKKAEDEKELVRRQLEHALVIQSSILNALPAHIALLDGDGNIVEVNEAWKRFAMENGYLGADFGIGSNYLQVASQARELGVEDAARAKEGIEGVIKGKLRQFEMEYSCDALSEQRWFTLMASPLSSFSAGAVVMHINVTEKHLAKNKLLASEANLRTIFENTDIAYTLLDSNLDVIAFNTQAETLLGHLFGKPLALGEHYFEYFNDTGETKMARSLMDSVAKGANYREEICKRTPEGTDRWYLVRISPIELENKLMGICLATSDITERKLAEIEREKMIRDIVQRNQHLQQFTYIVSHNLRAPVAKIAAFSEQMQDDTYTPEERTLFNTELVESVNKLDDVIKDLNQILKLGKMADQARERLDLAGIVNDVTQSLSGMLNKDEVVIISRFDEVSHLYSIKSYIHSIFYNLVINSIKYRQPGKKAIIHIESRNIDGQLKLIFRDNGLGIDLEKRGEAVFGLYKRFHTHVEGKGMGLFMTKAQVETLGGKIEIQSQVNKGTTFTITFIN